MGIAITTALLKTTQETTNRFLALPSPSGATWNEGAEEKIYTQSDPEGRIVFDEAMDSVRQPLVTLNYNRLTKELMAMRFGGLLEEGAVSDTGFAFSRRIGRLSFPPSATGFAGEGMSADIASASYLDNGISVPLTRQPFATFTGATVQSFAQGEDGELKFSDDLINKIVTVYGTYPTTDANVLGENLFDIFELKLFGVIQEAGQKEVFYIKVDRAQVVKADTSSTDFTAQDYPFSFRVLDSDCVAQLVFPGRRVAC